MKQFETNAFTLVIHDNLLKEFKVKKNVMLQEKDVWESRDLSVKYKPNTKFFVLVEGEENSQVSADARRAVASDEYYKDVAALALYSNKTLGAIGGNLFLKVNRPKVPTRFFDNREKALKWLNTQAEKTKV